jgi:hypothetical protein
MKKKINPTMTGNIYDIQWLAWEYETLVDLEMRRLNLFLISIKALSELGSLGTPLVKKKTKARKSK